jgi:hypothetical protein
MQFPSARALASIAFAVCVPLVAGAAGKPHSPYPERLDVPADTAAREAKCETLRARTARTGGWLGRNNALGRLNVVRSYHRAAERYLQQQCGDVDARGHELSHRAERSGRIVDTPAAAHADDHH